MKTDRKIPFKITDFKDGKGRGRLALVKFAYLFSSAE